MPGMSLLPAKDFRSVSPVAEPAARGGNVPAVPHTGGAPTAPAQLTQVSRELSEVIEALKNSRPGTGGYLQTIQKGGRLVQLQGSLTVPAKDAAGLQKRFSELRALLMASNERTEQAVEEVVPNAPVERWSKGLPDIFGRRLPGAPKPTAPARDGAPSRRDARRLGEGLDRTGQRANAAAKKLAREDSRAEKQAAISEARQTQVAARLHSRATEAMKKAERGARAELREIEASLQGGGAATTPPRRP